MRIGYLTVYQGDQLPGGIKKKEAFYIICPILDPTIELLIGNVRLGNNNFAVWQEVAITRVSQQRGGGKFISY